MAHTALRGAALVALALAVGVTACGDSGSLPDETTTTADPVETTLAEADTSTTEAETTTRLCVVDRDPGQVTNVLSGPSADADWVLELAHDAAVEATGETALDGAGDEWLEVHAAGGSGWVVSRFLTAGECSHAAPQPYFVTDIACGSTLNVRRGPSGDYSRLTTLEPDEAGVQGSGTTALDIQGRTWVQVVLPEGVGWVAGWFLQVGTINPLDCGPPPFPWLITPDAFGPITLGMAYADLPATTGLSWTVMDSYGECVWAEASGIGVQSFGGIVREVWALESGAGATVEGVAVGDSRAGALLAYGGRALVTEGPYLEEVIVIDAPAYTGSWSYLFNMTPGDVVLYIRINSGHGYIEGGCA